jgi:spore maturation protein CgeB
MNDYWSTNVEILRHRDSELCSRVDREPVLADVEKILCRNGDLTIRVAGNTLHSRYNPREEARRMVQDFVDRHQTELDRALTGTPVAVVVFGFGMGYHIEELIALLGRENLRSEVIRIVVVEPRYSILRAALESRDLSDVLSAISILAGQNPDLSEISASRGNSGTPILYVHAPSRKLDPNACHQVEAALNRGSMVTIQPKHLKILAISPIYGGSVPTLLYSADALKDMGHKVEILDNTPYYDLLMRIEQVTRDESHRNSLRGLLTTFLAESAVARAIDIRADVVFSVAQSPMVPSALQELRSLKVPTAFWFVEDRHLFPYWKEYAPLYDHFFVIQQGELLDELKSLGVKNAQYLPCAAHPPVHHPVQVTSDELAAYGSDLSFMGAGYYNRHQLFLKLLDFDFKIWGQEWNLESPLGRIVQRKGERIMPEEYIKIFSASKININLHSSPSHQGVNPHGDFVNPRTFELAACKAFQLVDQRSLLPQLFDVGGEIITFRDAGDLRDKIGYYLDRPEERAEIAQRSYDRVIAEHTYAHRMQTMLEKITAREPVLLTARAATDSPASLIEQAGTDSELGRFLARFADEDELTLDRISEEIRKGKGELTRTEGIFLLMKEFQDWAREKGVIGA